MADAEKPAVVYLTQRAPSNPLGTAALVCGILGVFLCGIMSPVAVALGCVALLWAPRVAAVFGILLGVLGSLIWLATTLAVFSVGV